VPSIGEGIELDGSGLISSAGSVAVHRHKLKYRLRINSMILLYQPGKTDGRCHEESSSVVTILIDGRQHM
jgi:hypothetical protein